MTHLNGLFGSALLKGLIGLFAAVLPSVAFADSCSVTATDVVFSQVSPIANADVSVSGTLSVTCNRLADSEAANALVCVNLGIGDASSSTVPRRLRAGTSYMNYNLYTSSSNATIWGDSAAGGTPISVEINAIPVGGSRATTVSFHGRVPSGQQTVPTLNNSATLYAENFNPGNAKVAYEFFQASAPACPALSNGDGFSFSASAEVINDCRIDVSPMNFGEVGLLSKTHTGTSSMSVICTNNAAYRISFNGGTVTGDVAGRKMKAANSNSTIDYFLYSDAALSMPWGDGSGGTATVDGTGTGLSTAVMIYARTPVQPTPEPDFYSDVVTATITF